MLFFYVIRERWPKMWASWPPWGLRLPQLLLYTNVRPKPGFGIGNRNQDRVLVLVWEPKLLLPKPKLPPFSFPQFFLMLFVPYLEYFLGYTQLSWSLCVNYKKRMENAKLVTNDMKKICRPLNIMLSNLRFYSFGKFRYRPKVTAKKGSFGRTLLHTELLFVLGHIRGQKREEECEKQWVLKAAFKCLST